MFVMADKGNVWRWTKLTESIYPVRKAGEPVYPHYREMVPRSWVEQGYVEQKEVA